MSTSHTKIERVNICMNEWTKTNKYVLHVNTHIIFRYFTGLSPTLFSFIPLPDMIKFTVSKNNFQIH